MYYEKKNIVRKKYLTSCLTTSMEIKNIKVN